MLGDKDENIFNVSARITADNVTYLCLIEYCSEIGEIEHEYR